ncbi:MAG: 12-oxophytodienoate reductase, partial [Pseudomonadota bacterium]
MTDLPMPASDILFRPFEGGNLTLKNRIAMAPMTRSMSPGNV